MIRPMNNSELAQAPICDECEDLATHCDSETTDYPLLLCAAHALKYAMVHGGTVLICGGKAA